MPVTDCIGKTSLKELLALLERATVLVSPDSGPAHMAVAAGTPVIGLDATSNPDRMAVPGAGMGGEPLPGGGAGIAWQGGGGRRAWGRRVRKPDAMELIQVADVLERLDTLLGTPSAERLSAREGSRPEA
ncbi:MAG: glycosyltransferase family 9 protein [Arhodomonas sp.]|nr:glycosyltransferase family 9 protein [Arhodomonas sp.]